MIGDKSRNSKIANIIHFDNEDLLKKASILYDFNQESSDFINAWYNRISHNHWTNLKFENILNIGSGVGFPLLNICLSKRKSKVISVDISHKTLEYCRGISKKIEVDPFLVQCDGEFLPFKDCSFDAITGNAIIHHIPDTQKIANEIYRLLKPNGICIITGESTKKGANINNNIKRFFFYFKLKRKKMTMDLVDIHTFFVKDLRKKFGG
jgi:ubiquinone/menaquinone biosynthesis C-methylase UbiE